jgi:putative ABC transport system substrate-binding protein
LAHLLGVALLIGGASALAQEPGRIYRLGIMAANAREDPPFPAFFDDLRRLGFIEGQNLKVKGHFSMRDEDAQQVAKTLVETGVDAIVTGGYPRTRAAQNATRTIPILTVGDDLLLMGLVDSLARPGGNTTGLSILATELDSKRQQLLIELVPAAHRMAALADPGITRPEQRQALQEGARQYGVELSIHLVSNPREISPAIDAARAAGAQGLNVLAASIFNANQRLIIEQTVAIKLPAIFQWPEIAAAGGLAAYGPNYNELYRQHARQLVKLLQGIKPADVPVEQPDKFELAINLRTAKAIGLEVPETLLARADEVIE